MKPATMASVCPDEDKFTVGAVGLIGGAMGHMPQSPEQISIRAIDQLSQNWG